MGKELEPAALLAYLDEAERFLVRSAGLHWRATTSEWYLGHFFRKRVERFFDRISAQDLVDMVYSRSMMAVEREALYEMADQVRTSPALAELFARQPFDSLVAARLERMADPAAARLVEGLRAYGRRYGWMGDGGVEEGALRPGGEVSLREAVGRLRRCLHVDVAAYRRNVRAIGENGARLRALGRSRCATPEEVTLFETALKAGEKAYLAGDDHTFYICARKFVFASDALWRIGAALAAQGQIAVPGDVRFLTLAEVRACLARPEPLHGTVVRRREEHAAWSGRMAPRELGPAPDEPTAAPPAPPDAATEESGAVVLQGESGTRARARGRIHAGFPSAAAGEGLILLLEHGHEGDLTTVLRQVAGLVLQGGTPACHMGIIARELGIPAIYGVGPRAAVLADGDEVEIRGETGEVVRVAAAARPEPGSLAARPPGPLPA
ncbi:MAG: PEP-utilizing enzyme [Gemmatimonadota bacterium]